MTTLPENAEPMPEQWLAWFHEQTPEVQLEQVTRLMALAREARLCFEADHRGLIDREQLVRIDVWTHPEDHAAAYIHVLRGGIVKITEPLLAGLLTRAGWTKKESE